MPTPDTSAAGRPLAPEELRRACDPSQFPFDTSADAEDFADILGQRRAAEAIRFAVEMEHEGYNLYAMGPEGIGRHGIVRRFLEERAPGRPTPSDWCYVFDFDTADRPRAMAFPPGGACRFRDDMARLVEDLRTGIPAAFERDEFRARAQEIESELEEGQEKTVARVGDLAKARGIALVRTPSGFGFAPLSGDSVMDPDEFQALPKDKQEALQTAISELEAELARAVQDIPKLRREAQRRMRELIRQVTGATVSSLIEEMKAAYAAQPEVLAHLARGLDGGHGVIIPAANVRHLMLREEVVQAVRDGRFAVHAVSTIDEALGLLAVAAAGERDHAGNFLPPESVNARVERRLTAYAEARPVAATPARAKTGRRS